MHPISLPSASPTSLICSRRVFFCFFAPSHDAHSPPAPPLWGPSPPRLTSPVSPPHPLSANLVARLAASLRPFAKPRTSPVNTQSCSRVRQLVRLPCFVLAQGPLPTFQPECHNTSGRPSPFDCPFLQMGCPPYPYSKRSLSKSLECHNFWKCD